MGVRSSGMPPPPYPHVSGRCGGIFPFGSRARGDWLLTSDADVMIVSPDFVGRRFVDRSAEILRHWRGRVDLEAFCYTPEEIAERRHEIGIIGQALKEGRRI